MHQWNDDVITAPHINTQVLVSDFVSYKFVPILSSIDLIQICRHKRNINY